MRCWYCCYYYYHHRSAFEIGIYNDRSGKIYNLKCERRVCVCNLKKNCQCIQASVCMVKPRAWMRGLPWALLLNSLLVTLCPQKLSKKLLARKSALLAAENRIAAWCINAFTSLCNITLEYFLVYYSLYWILNGFTLIHIL